MHKNRSPSSLILIIFLYSFLVPMNSGQAVTHPSESEEPLTIKRCKKLLEESKTDDMSPENPSTEANRTACEKLLMENEIEVPKKEDTTSNPEPEPPKNSSEDNVTVTPGTETEEPLIPPTSESESPTTPEPHTSESDTPTPPDLPISDQNPPADSDSDEADVSLSEDKEAPLVSLPASEEKSKELQEQLSEEKKEPSREKLQAPEVEKKESIPKEQAVTPRLAGVALLGNSSLNATYNATTKTIELVNDVSSLLNLNISSGYIIFRLPPEVMQSIEANSVQLQYRYSVLIGTRTVAVEPVIDRINNQIYADVGAFLKLSLLSNDRFTLSFKVGQLPIGLNKMYTFKSALVDGLIDLNVLSGNTATATLGIGPTFSLIVPSMLDFGSHELTGRETIISRLEPMTISIAHENATGYNWRLQAGLTRPLTSTEGDVLKDVLYFKTATTKQLLQATAIEVASGQMTSNQNQTPLTYAKEEGIILDLTGKYATPSTYSADIQWSLINAP